MFNISKELREKFPELYEQVDAEKKKAKERADILEKQAKVSMDMLKTIENTFGKYEELDDTDANGNEIDNPIKALYEKTFADAFKYQQEHLKALQSIDAPQSMRDFSKVRGIQAKTRDGSDAVISEEELNRMEQDPAYAQEFLNSLSDEELDPKNPSSFPNVLAGKYGDSILKSMFGDSLQAVQASRIPEPQLVEQPVEQNNRRILTPAEKNNQIVSYSDTSNLDKFNNVVQTVKSFMGNLVDKYPGMSTGEAIESVSNKARSNRTKEQRNNLTPGSLK